PFVRWGPVFAQLESRVATRNEVHIVSTKGSGSFGDGTFTDVMGLKVYESVTADLADFDAAFEGDAVQGTLAVFSGNAVARVAFEGTLRATEPLKFCNSP